MAEQELLNAFNDCIDRLHQGQSIDDCVRQYPHHASVLRAMLETGQAVRRARINPLEVAQAQERVRYRVAEAVRSRPPELIVYPMRRLAALAASFVLVFLLVATGGSILAQSSIPGDPLYGLKRLTEDARLSLSGGSSSLQEEFAARRVDETRQLLTLRRTQDVTFRGRVGAIIEDMWVIADLPVQVPPETPGASLARVGDLVEVQGYTTPQGELIAVALTVIRPGEQVETLPLPPTSTDVPTRAAPTNTATLTATSTPTPSPSATSTTTPTASPTPSATRVLITPLPTTCVPRLPDGWVEYTIQVGDTLSAIAAAGGITVEQLMNVNCLTDARLIVAGQRVFTPVALPRLTAPPGGGQVIQPTAHSGQQNQNSGGNSGSGHGGGGNNDNDDDDNNGNDDHGGDDDNDDN